MEAALTFFSITIALLMVVMMAGAMRNDYFSYNRDGKDKTGVMAVMTGLASGWAAFNITDYITNCDWFVVVIVTAIAVPSVVFLICSLWLSSR